MLGKIQLPAENCWVIRGTSLNDPNKYLYHIAANEWNHAALVATVYHNEDSARRLIDDMRRSNRVGFGPQDIVEPVPLLGAVLNHPDYTVSLR